MGFILYFFAQVVLISLLESGVTSLTCLACEDVALPILCTSIAKCGSHEVCELEQYITEIGSLRYKQSCIDRNQCLHRRRETARQADRSRRITGSVICTSCCDSHLCNSGGCGNKVFADDYAQGLCYSCDTQIGHNMCNNIQQCGRDQICHIEHLDIPGAPKNVFRTQCSHPQTCFAPSLIGKKRSGCSSCCNGSLCNDFDPTQGCHDSSTSTSVPIVISTLPTSTVPVTTGATVTSQAATATTTQSVTNTATTTKASHVAHGDCHDVFANCPDTFCHLQAYHDWALANCRKTCGLCGDTGSATSGTSGLVKVTTTTASVTSSVTGGGIGPGLNLVCTDKASGCLASLHCSGDYAAWGLQNCKKTCKVCTIHTSPVEGGGVYLMLKTVAGVKTPDIYALWEQHRTLNSHIPAFADFLATFKGHFKSDFSNQWTQRKFNEVTVAMYINGTEKASITFNATGADKLSWFHADRIIRSSWAGHLTANNNMAFEMQKKAATGFEFNAEASHGAGCDSRGWMTIVADSTCLPSAPLEFPAFLFCPNTTPCSWKDGQYVAAEVFAIHAHSTGKIEPGALYAYFTK